MKKSEVIKLMKEGTHCIYNDCDSKQILLKEITEYNVVRIYPKYYYRYLDGGVQASNFPFKELEIINLSEIEPDNEKPYLFYEGEKYYFGEEYEFSDDGIHFLKGKFYSYTDDSTFKVFYHSTNYGTFGHIRKIDHTTKYKKLFLELKEQAEKDGVNLKELI